MDYDEIRHSLFAESYVASKIIELLRKKYKISHRITPSEWGGRLLRDHSSKLEAIHKHWEISLKRKIPKEFFAIKALAIEEITQEVTPEITKIANELNLDENYFRNLVLFNGISTRNAYLDARVVLASPLMPITKIGVYIRVEKGMKNNEFVKCLKQSQILLESQSSQTQKLIKLKKRKRMGDNEQGKIVIYKLVEKRIKKIAKDKYPKNRLDYEGELVRPSIEQVAGDILSRSDHDDKSFVKLEKEWTKKIGYLYYMITRRYRLPTPKKLPSILRLI